MTKAWCLECSRPDRRRLVGDSPSEHGERVVSKLDVGLCSIESELRLIAFAGGGVTGAPDLLGLLLLPLLMLLSSLTVLLVLCARLSKRSSFLISLRIATFVWLNRSLK